MLRKRTMIFSWIMIMLFVTAILLIFTSAFFSQFFFATMIETENAVKK